MLVITATTMDVPVFSHTSRARFSISFSEDESITPAKSFTAPLCAGILSSAPKTPWESRNKQSASDRRNKKLRLKVCFPPGNNSCYPDHFLQSSGPLQHFLRPALQQGCHTSPDGQIVYLVGV